MNIKDAINKWLCRVAADETELGFRQKVCGGCSLLNTDQCVKKEVS